MSLTEWLVIGCIALIAAIFVAAGVVSRNEFVMSEYDIRLSDGTEFDGATHVCMYRTKVEFRHGGRTTWRMERRFLSQFDDHREQEQCPD